MNKGRNGLCDYGGCRDSAKAVVVTVFAVERRQVRFCCTEHARKWLEIYETAQYLQELGIK